MFAQLRNDYTEYKQKSFCEQLLRSSNTLFAVFTFWNLVRNWVLIQQSSFSPLGVMLLGLATAFAGIVFGVLLLIWFSRRIHLLILPTVAVACVMTVERDEVSRLWIVPAVSFVSLVFVRIIVLVANKLNRV